MLYLPSLILVMLIYVMALLAMAFYTLLERKILGYIQIRKGPNKVGFMGVLQPFADAAKLFTKELKQPMLSNFSPFLFAPMLSLFLSLLMWSLMPVSFSSMNLAFGVLIFLCVSSLNVYSILGAGWTSNSKYSLLGALRAIAQTISYEISMVLILLIILITMMSFNFLSYLSTSQFIALIFPLSSMIWLTTILAETNRTPFDFAEGESELVSGFNTEYSSGSFAMIFMAEYASIIIMSILTSFLFFPSSNSPMFILSAPFMGLVVGILFIWARGTLPRLRYDRLMNMTWKSFLPFSLALLMFFSPFLI